MDYVHIINLLAIVLTLIMAYVVKSKLYIPRHEKDDLIRLAAILIVSCIIEPFSYKNTYNQFVIKLLNSYMYMAYIVISYHWFVFLHKHMFGYFSKRSMLLGAIPMVVVFILVIINFFVPFLFKLDGNNNYIRGWGYYIALDFNLLYIVASLGHFVWSVKKSGGTTLFPVLAILLPVILGLFIQTFTPYLSVVLACVSIGLAGVIAGLQNETIYRDHLTGIYNRAYIDVLFKRYRKKSFVGVMLDLNNFKVINDTYGHKEGDLALINFSNIMHKYVGVEGTCIRYAGDEFIIFFAYEDEKKAEIVLNNINIKLQEYKLENNIPYDITFSYGLSKFDPHNTSFDEFLNNIDSNMYSNKRNYYNEAK